MSRSLRTLTEAQIRKAEAEGKLSGLAGEGRPLPDRTGEAFLDAGTGVAHRIMAEAGVRPQEFDLKEKLDAARRAHAAARTEDARRETMAAIARAEMAYAMAVEARRRFIR
jgi:hypothetical protein